MCMIEGPWGTELPDEYEGGIDELSRFDCCMAVVFSYAPGSQVLWMLHIASGDFRIVGPY